MGLFDKIKDNAKTISLKALEEIPRDDQTAVPVRKTSRTVPQLAGNTYRPSHDEEAEPVTVRTTDKPVVASTGHTPTAADMYTDKAAVIAPADSDAPPSSLDDAVMADLDDLDRQAESAASQFLDIEPEPTPKAKTETPPEPAEKPAEAVKHDVKIEPTPEPEPAVKTEPPKASAPDTTEEAAKSRTTPKIVSKPKSTSTPPPTGHTPRLVGGRGPNLAPTPAPAPAAQPKHFDVQTTASQRDPERAKKLLYARERAAIATLAAQKRMNGAVPFYTSTYLNFKIRVFIDRVEYIGSFGKNVIPMDTVAWVKLRAGGTGMIIETKDTRRIVMVVKPKDRIDLAEAIIKVQEMQPKRVKKVEDKSLRIDYLDKVSTGIEELEKLAILQEKGIITKEEFEAKKKQILDL